MSFVQHEAPQLAKLFWFTHVVLQELLCVLSLGLYPPPLGSASSSLEIKFLYSPIASSQLELRASSQDSGLTGPV